MLRHIVIILAVSSALNAITPDELDVLWSIVDTIMVNREHDANTVIKNAELNLTNVIQQAEYRVNTNLELVANNYWVLISNLENDPKNSGKNISACIDAGNQKVYKLNATVLLPAITLIKSYNTTATNLLVNGSKELDHAVSEATNITTAVNQCKTETCADKIEQEILDYFDNVGPLLVSIPQVINNYISVELPTLLNDINIDFTVYIEGFMSIIKEIEACIAKL
ncbi:hypothetical protein ABEB36_012705 [Hypothenemus hampei]|uniref:Uncharacterized protein n=1 Tax=Hypothenemus hampei TaxID=57062 RepID=A0ABD1EC40_HYPHA